MAIDKRIILVVEDDADTAELFTEMLTVSGFAVQTSALAMQALQMIKEDPPAAILLDVMMPDVSGLAVLEFVRSQPELDHIPVVVVSAWDLPGEVEEAITAGAFAFLTKPVNFYDLRQTLEEALAAAE